MEGNLNKIHWLFGMPVTSYNVSAMLKDAYYDDACGSYYHTDEGYDSFECTGKDVPDFYNSANRYRIGAPILYEAQRWLRQQYNMDIVLTPFADESTREYYYDIDVYRFFDSYGEYDIVPNGNKLFKGEYEDALNEGLRMALEWLHTMLKEAKEDYGKRD